MNILPVKTKAQIKEIEKLACIIWREHYKNIISLEQIEYMLEKFQSFEAISAQISDGYIFCLLENEGVNLGYISYKTSENKLFLSKIYVLADFRGRGYAKNAIEFLKKECADNSCSKIWLTVNQNNINSIKTYEKMGFFNARVQIADIGNGFKMEDFVMELEI